MVHIDFALVHELDQASDILEAAVTHQNDRILAVEVVVAEDGLEVRAASAQHDAMRAQRLALARNRHVAEAAAVQQLREHVLQIVLVVLPFQTVLLCHCGATGWLLCGRL